MKNRHGAELDELASEAVWYSVQGANTVQREQDWHARQIIATRTLRALYVTTMVDDNGLSYAVAGKLLSPPISATRVQQLVAHGRELRAANPRPQPEETTP